jgi:hypothetical protein
VRAVDDVADAVRLEEPRWLASSPVALKNRSAARSFAE